MEIKSRIQQCYMNDSILTRSEFDGEFGGEDHVADPEGWGGVAQCPDLNLPFLVIHVMMIHIRMIITLKTYERSEHFLL